MQLESALRTSSSGISTHGRAIAVVGDNISNVSTYGFKKSRAEFADIVADGRGSINSPAGPQSGDGVRLNAVRQIHIDGIIEDTGRNLDLAIAGNGFFMVGDPEAPSYTRAGNFSLNQAGQLVDPENKPVLGFAPDTVDNFVLQPLNTTGIGIEGVATQNVVLGGILNSTLDPVTIVDNPATSSEIASNSSFTHTAKVYDSLGEEHDLIVAFYKTANNQWSARGFIDGGDVGQTAGVPSLVAPNVELEFNENGQIVGNPALNFNLPYANGSLPSAVTMDLSGFSQVAASSAINATTQDGSKATEVNSIEVDEVGNINAVFGDGRTRSLGIIGLADFINKDGLIREGGYGYVASAEAGEPIVGTANINRFGEIRSGALERSTVDISEEFVDLVVFQRGYQANSQTLTATSTLLQQTIQLIR